jgi:hypothetical protein
LITFEIISLSIFMTWWGPIRRHLISDTLYLYDKIDHRVQYYLPNPFHLKIALPLVIISFIYHFFVDCQMVIF